MATNLYNFNSGDYRDRYTRETGWVKLLFNHGRPLQTAELIEMQSLMQDFMKQGLDTLFANGTVIYGLKFELLSKTVDESIFTISSGKFYVDGIVLDVPGQTITVNNTGEFNIGLSITPSIITEEEVPNLRDPVKEGALYGLPGAARLIWNTTLVIDDTTAFTLARVVNGGLIQKETNLYSKIDESLANYTYARTGNFCLPGGLEVSVIEASKRAITDVVKYNTLQDNTTNLVNETQEAYSQVLNAKTSLDNLTSQIQAATLLYNRTPTNSNLIALQDLQLRLEDSTARYNELSRLYTSKKIISDKAEQSLISAKSLLTDKVYFSVSPGVAYVEGYRVPILSPVVLEVPKSLEVSKVNGAIFTYSGNQAVTLRTFSLVSFSLWADVVSQNTLLSINFTKLLYNQQFVDIKLQVNLTNNSFNSIDTLLTFITTELNKPVSESLNVISISSTTLSLSNEVLRTIFKNNLVIEKVGTALQITSTTLNEVANQIEVNITIKERDSNNVVIDDSRVLLVDVNFANLSGAGKSNSYQLGLRPVSEIINVTADLAEYNKPIIRRVTPGTTDKLGDDSIFKITKVYQGNTTYVEGIDYQLINQSEIDWSLSSINASEPAAGTTYYVSFLYTQPLAKGTDYQLNQATDSIEFINTTPAPNQRFYVDYTYYLSKVGIITLDKEGNLNFTLSSSGVTEVPVVAPNLLPLATFKLYANSTEVTSSDCKILKNEEIQSIVELVKKNTCELENQRLDVAAQLDAADKEVTPIGYYNSSLQDLSKVNLDNSTGAIAPAIQSLTGGYIHKDVDLKYVSGGTVSNNEFGNRYFVTLPYSNSVLLSQNRLTKVREVSSPISINKRAKIIAYPELIFNNKPFSKFTSCDPLTKATTLLTRLSENNPLILQNIATNNQVLFKSFGEKLYKSFIEGTPIGNIFQSTLSFLGYISNLVKSNTNLVKVKVEELPPNNGGYKVYLSGTEIRNYTLLDSTPLSVEYPGSIRSKSDGTISFSFTIPTDLVFGSHSLEIISVATTGSKGYAKTQIGVYNNLFTQIVLSTLENWDISFNRPIADSFLLKLKSSKYDSQAFQFNSSIVNPGTLPNISSTALTTEQQFPILFDSIYQTFKVYDYCYLTKVKLKLRSIDLNEDLIVNLGEADLVDKAPNRSYYSSAFSNLYQPSTNGTNWTEFTFSYPILIDPKKLYNFSLYSKGSGYKVFSAEVAGTDLLTGGLVGDQLYLEGELFYSNEGKALNRLEREDLTYELQKATFTIANEVIVNLGNYGIVDNLSSVSSFCLNSRDILPSDTFIQYQYQLIGTNTWVNFDSNKLVCLDTPVFHVAIRAKLSSLRNNVSPALMLQGSSVSLYLGLSSSYIISNQITYNRLYKDIYVTLDYLQPAETNIKVYYSPNEGLPTQGQEWFELTKDTTTDKFIDAGLQIKEATWKLSNATLYISNGEGRNRFRWKVEFTTNNVAIQPNVLNIKTYVA
jgi:hypothetical protein